MYFRFSTENSLESLETGKYILKKAFMNEVPIKMYVVISA